MTVALRKAVPEDALRIAQVQVRSWEAATRGDKPDSVLDGLSIPHRTEDWTKRLVPAEGEMLVVLIDGVIEGWTSLGPSRDSDKQDAGEVYGIYLSPDFIGENLGMRLYAGAEASLAALGCKEIILWVVAANAQARQFYEKAGCHLDGAEKSILWEGARIDEVRYAKSLSS
jgi:ribosomal protein S18 acetylase RimI-like enzyme